ncbi:hypothetical protein ACLMJK_001346 [Lecanora helva]
MNLHHSSSLYHRLTEVLPAGCRITIHHLSTPPTRSRPLYAAPPGELAEETYCENHFLSVSIESNGSLVQIYGIEVLIYTTEFLTTLFVSKADSTGYLYLLNLPFGTRSPLKNISTTFLQYLVEKRKRWDRRLVLSLFARAQNQYLFPGSIDNVHKHVLDDRGLIKWWCQVVDPLLGSHKDNERTVVNRSSDVAKEGREVQSRGFLRVPGCDKYETKTFLPKVERSRTQNQHRWQNSDPLIELGKAPDLPERCLIPRFPDDPKARFVEQLDEELPDESAQSSKPETQDSRVFMNQHHAGRWRSVRSMEQFWDLMSYRQECSSGRLVGFLWATFQPTSFKGPNEVEQNIKRLYEPLQVSLPTPEVSQEQEISVPLPPQSPLRSSPVPELPATPSNHNVAPAQQTPDPTPQKAKRAAIDSQPEETKHYYWPRSSRGEVVLRHKDYQRTNNLLLKLDYENQEVSMESTKRWISDVAQRAGLKSWGREILGSLPIASSREKEEREETSLTLNASLVRKKKRPIHDIVDHTGKIGPETGGPQVNMLGTGLIRKKAKVTEASSLPPAESLLAKRNAVSG